MKKLVLSTIILFVAKIIFAQNIDTVQFAKWVKANAIELNENSGFAKLAEVLSNKTIIGLGECVHGSKTINNIRFDVTKALIEKNDFDNIAFEMSFNTGLRINHYLQTGEGNIEQILQESHFFLNSAEMLDFVKWIKHYNEQSVKPVNIYGFDIQVNIDIVEDLQKYYANTDKKAENITATLIGIIANNGGIWAFRKYPEILQDSVMKITSRLTEKHHLNRKEYILKSGFVEYEYAAKRIEVLSNLLKMINSGYGQSLIMRDSCNAELIKWIKNFEGEKSKIILLAHNGHLGKSLWFYPRARTLSTQGFYEYFPEKFITGYYLNEIFDDEYYFIGTQFSSGFFMGFDPENEFRLSKLEVTPPESDSFTNLLQLAADKSPYFIQLYSYISFSQQEIDYLCSLQSFYHIGAAYDYKYNKARLINFFDAIIYVDKVEESNLFEFEE